MLNSYENKYSNCATKKWCFIGSETKGNYSHENPINFFTSSIESNFCNYSGAYNLVTGNIAVIRTITAANAGAKPQRKQEFTVATQVAFKKCRTEINLENVGQKSMKLLLLKQILLILQCLCTI